jgi:hypothetical protein
MRLPPAAVFGCAARRHHARGPGVGEPGGAEPFDRGSHRPADQACADAHLCPQGPAARAGHHGSWMQRGRQVPAGDAVHQQGSSAVPALERCREGRKGKGGAFRELLFRAAQQGTRHRAVEHSRTKPRIDGLTWDALNPLPRVAGLTPDPAREDTGSLAQMLGRGAWCGRQRKHPLTAAKRHSDHTARQRQRPVCGVVLVGSRTLVRFRELRQGMPRRSSLHGCRTLDNRQNCLSRGGGREVPAQEPFSAPETICTFCTGGHAKESRANLPVFTGKFPFCA